MTEPVFSIITKNKVNLNKNKDISEDAYSNLYQNYLSSHYGYYTQFFLKKIVENSQNKHSKLLKFQLRKLIRQAIKKFLITDLELVYFSYFANTHSWNYQHPVILEAFELKQSDPEIYQMNLLKLFLNLISFFVKSYVGQAQELNSIITHQRQTMPLFFPIYKFWLQQNPRNLFQISPRQLNCIYSQYSRNCGQKVQRKDYNQMVDRVLELSTTYSIMNTKQKKKITQKKFVTEVSREQISMMQPQRRLTRNSDLNLNDSNFRMDFSDLRSNKKQSIIISGLNPNPIPPITLRQDKPRASQSQPKKLISLNKKKKNTNQVNTVARNFFNNKESGLPFEEQKKNEKELNPSILDMNLLSSRIENLPFNYRNNSNIFAPSTLF